MYFRLNPECYFIRGEKYGAVFDLIEGDIYALDKQETEIISSLESNKPVDKGEKFIKNLRRLCLGNFYSRPVYIQKLRVGSPIQDKQLYNPPSLIRGFIEINNSCNRDCYFCGYYGINRSYGCMGCNKWNEGGDLLRLNVWKRLIGELRDLGCKDLFITGGDLTLAWEKTMELLDCAHGDFSNIYLILHRQSISKEIKKDIASKATAIIQTEDLFSTQFDNSLLNIILDNRNSESREHIKNQHHIMSFVIQDQNQIPNDLPMISKEKLSAKMYSFLNNIRYHPCLGHTISICFNGKVIPCPTMRNYSLGNVGNLPLYSIFQEKKIYKFWKLTMEKIDKCKECEYRFACDDCRSLEEALTGKLNGKRLCSYNPKEGVWS